jgi:hypothetical protein
MVSLLNVGFPMTGVTLLDFLNLQPSPQREDVLMGIYEELKEEFAPEEEQDESSDPPEQASLDSIILQALSQDQKFLETLREEEEFHSDEEALDGESAGPAPESRAQRLAIRRTRQQELEDQDFQGPKSRAKKATDNSLKTLTATNTALGRIRMGLNDDTDAKAMEQKRYDLIQTLVDLGEFTNRSRDNKTTTHSFTYSTAEQFSKLIFGMLSQTGVGYYKELIESYVCEDDPSKVHLRNAAHRIEQDESAPQCERFMGHALYSAFSFREVNTDAAGKPLGKQQARSRGEYVAYVCSRLFVELALRQMEEQYIRERTLPPHEQILTQRIRKSNSIKAPGQGHKITHHVSQYIDSLLQAGKDGTLEGLCKDVKGIYIVQQATSSPGVVAFLPQNAQYV